MTQSLTPGEPHSWSVSPATTYRPLTLVRFFPSDRIWSNGQHYHTGQMTQALLIRTCDKPSQLRWQNQSKPRAGVERHADILLMDEKRENGPLSDSFEYLAHNCDQAHWTVVSLRIIAKIGIPSDKYQKDWTSRLRREKRYNFSQIFCPKLRRVVRWR